MGHVSAIDSTDPPVSVQLGYISVDRRIEMRLIPRKVVTGACRPNQVDVGLGKKSLAWEKG